MRGVSDTILPCIYDTFAQPVKWTGARPMCETMGLIGLGLGEGGSPRKCMQMVQSATTRGGNLVGLMNENCISSLHEN